MSSDLKTNEKNIITKEITKKIFFKKKLMDEHLREHTSSRTGVKQMFWFPKGSIAD